MVRRAYSRSGFQERLQEQQETNCHMSDTFVTVRSVGNQEVDIGINKAFHSRISTLEIMIEQKSLTSEKSSDHACFHEKKHRENEEDVFYVSPTFKISLECI